jgi:hypothetical protein
MACNHSDDITRPRLLHKHIAVNEFYAIIYKTPDNFAI